MCISKVSVLTVFCHISKKNKKNSGLIHEGHVTLPLEWDIATYDHMQIQNITIVNRLLIPFLHVCKCNHFK